MGLERGRGEQARLDIGYFMWARGTMEVAEAQHELTSGREVVFLVSREDLRKRLERRRLLPA